MQPALVTVEGTIVLRIFQIVSAKFDRRGNLLNGIFDRVCVDVYMTSALVCATHSKAIEFFALAALFVHNNSVSVMWIRGQSQSQSQRQIYSSHALTMMQ